MSQLISQQEAVRKAREDQLDIYNRPWGLWGVRTGFYCLDMMTGGWTPGTVVSIAARSGVGKSATTVQMFQAGEHPENNRKPMFCFATFEMTPEMIIDRNVCNLLGISYRRLKLGIKMFRKDELANLKTAYDRSKNLPVYYYPISTDIESLKDIFRRFVENEVEKEIRRTGLNILPVLVIDYIGAAEFQGAVRTYSINDFTKGTKSIAKEVGGCVVQFAQLRRDSDEKKEPDISDISDSSFIENNSDSVLILHRPELHGKDEVFDPEKRADVPSKGKMLVMAKKGRFLGVGAELINCDIKSYSFWSQHHHRDAEYWRDYNNPDFWKRQFNLR